MTTAAFAPNTNPLASDPNYALGIADAYDEYTAGTTIDTLLRRSHEMLDTPHHSLVAELYMAGYANTVVGLYNGHLATLQAQTTVAWHDKAARR